MIRHTPPPFASLLDALEKDDILGAIKLWSAHCAANGTCSRGYKDQKQPRMYCANMLHASLLGRAMGGMDSENMDYHTQAQKLANWIGQHDKS